MPSTKRTNELIAMAVLSTLAGIANIGNVFYVNSAHAATSDQPKSNRGVAGRGRSPDFPFATLDYAVGQCTAANGDTIFVAAGHSETLVAAAGVDADVSGITIHGVGNGTNKPLFTMGTLTTATFRINAANVTVRGLQFVNNIDSLVKFVNVNADYATIEDCDFLTSSTKEALSFVNIATTKDYTTVRRCTFVQPTDPAGTNGGADTGAIYLVDSEHVTVEDCYFSGNFETACIHNRTTGAAELWVRRCWGISNLSDAVPFVLVSTATGGADRCSIINPNEAATTEATLSGTFPAAFFNFQSYFGNDGGGGQNAIASQAAAS